MGIKLFKNISFRVTVLSLFFFLALIIITFMSYIQTYYNKQFAQNIVNKNFKVVSSKISENLKLENSSNEFFIDAISSSFSKLDSIDNIIEDKNTYIKVMTNLLLENDNLYSAYFAFSDNSFFEILNLDINVDLKKQYNLKNDARWLLIYINGKDNTKRELVSYTKELKVIDKKIDVNSYKPTVRPWYTKAFNAKNTIIKSEPYFFKHIDTMGITYAKQYNNNVVFAIDFLLNNLDKQLMEYSDISSMDSFLFSKNKQLISSTTKDFNIITDIKKLVFNNKLKNRLTKNIYTINNKKYILNFIKIDKSVYEYFVSIVPLDDVMDEYSKYFVSMLAFTIILFLILLPIIWYFASIIVKPVLDLKTQSLKVRNRDYSKMKEIKSRVFEIQSLSDSMTDMAKSISLYQNELESKVKERTKELEEKNKELEILSVTDKLTNIYNRIKLDEVMLEQINRAQRYDEIFSIIILDVDYFKKVNDVYGHQVGDKTLVEISKILQKNTRKSDTVGRWGGEEFMIICPHTDLKGVKDLANHIRAEIENHNFPVIKTKTASFGISIYKKGDSLEKLIKRADEALYLAKSKGRNRVEVIINS